MTSQTRFDSGLLGGPSLSCQISIVTPSYNQGRFITAAVDSVLGQAYPNLEYFVVDGGSRDNTKTILEKYGKAIRWISEPDLGQADAINKGFQGTQGDILGWLNADDTYCPETLKEVAAQFENDPELMMLYGDANHVDVEGHFIEKYPTKSYCLDHLAFQCFICQPACFFRRSLLEVVGHLDPRLQYALDLDLWIRFGIAQKKNPQWKFRYLSKVLALSRMYQENKTLSKRKEVYEEIMEVVKKHFSFTPFNWVYGLEEVTAGLGDGYSHKTSFSVFLLSRSILRWTWINRNHPTYILQFLFDRLRNPTDSLKRISQRTHHET